MLEQKSSDLLDKSADTGSGTLSSGFFSLSTLDLGLDLLLDSWKMVSLVSSLPQHMPKIMTYTGCTGGTRMHRDRSVKPTLAVTSRNMGRVSKSLQHPQQTRARASLRYILNQIELYRAKESLQESKTHSHRRKEQQKSSLGTERQSWTVITEHELSTRRNQCLSSIHSR